MNTSLKTLVIAEHDGKQLNPDVRKAVSAAQSWTQGIDLLIFGHETDALVKQAVSIDGVQRVLVVKAPHLAHVLAEDAANVIHGIATAYRVIIAAHSSFSRNILPRVAALLDVAMIADVLKIQTNNTYIRSTYAGNVHATLQSLDRTQVLTVHASHFKDAANGGNAEVVQLTPPSPVGKTRWLSEQRNQSSRPALNIAKVVVTGGRSLGSAENFDKLLAPLADKLGAALGATRAAVDAGYAPNDIQVGQTGVVVAPDIYFAIGVSGAIQHTYGMKDSKVVIAINQDPDAPIFQVADYGLVADLFEVVPEIAALVAKA